MTESDTMNTLSKLDVATAAQWRAAGISQARLTTLIRRGQLVRLRHGVYATGTILAETETDPGRRHALQVAAATTGAQTPAGAASHHSAALIHGLDLLRKPPNGTVTVTVPPGARSGRHRPGDTIRHEAGLPAEHVISRFGVLVTTAARTVVDLARAGTLMEAVVVADSALRRNMTTKAELRQVLEYCERWPGLSQARRVIDLASMLAESVLESCARVVFHEHGLPRPALQVTVGGGEFRGRADFCWTEYRTIAEAEGPPRRRGHAEAAAEVRWDRLLRAAGYEVVHFTWRELSGDPARVVARVRYAFARGAAPARRVMERLRQAGNPWQMNGRYHWVTALRLPKGRTRRVPCRIPRWRSAACHALAPGTSIAPSRMRARDAVCRAARR